MFVLRSVRIKYIKDESVKYVSHLDTLKTFTRAARRAQLPLVYSNGYNPHPHFVFGLPASVGMVSICEYADIDFEDGIENNQIMDKLNTNLPEGFRVTECFEKLSSSNIMAELTAAEYVIYPETEYGVPELQDFISHFIGCDEIIVSKKNKKGERDINIKSMIKFISTGEDNTGKYLIAKLSAGNETNLKPELLIEAINKYEGTDLSIRQIIRTEMFLKGESVI